MGCGFGVPRCHETAGDKEKQGEKDKDIEEEETKNATKTATILWWFLLAILTLKLGISEILAIFMPTNRGYSHFYTPPVLGGATLFGSSAPAVFKIQGP